MPLTGGAVITQILLKHLRTLLLLGLNLLMAKLFYGSGLRPMECLRLPVKTTG